MNDIIFLLLRASISTSLSDRAAFIDRLAEIIETHTGRDEEAARKLSDNIAGAMEGLNGTLLLQQLFRPHHDKKLNKSIDSLTEAIEKLRAILEAAEQPAASSNNDKL